MASKHGFNRVFSQEKRGHVTGTASNFNNNNRWDGLFYIYSLIQLLQETSEADNHLDEET